MGFFDNIERENTIKERELALNTSGGSAKATFDEAEAMYKLVTNGIKGIDISNKEEAYAFNNAISTQLALICELYLKALYIFEQQLSTKTVEELWNSLRNPSKLDPSRPRSSSGHHLDILIDNLSFDTKTILKNRIATLDKTKETGKVLDINIFDILKKHGLIDDVVSLELPNIDASIEEHKNTFAEARYGGQSFSKPDIKFLQHLTTQISVVARYKISPVRGRQIDVTKYQKGSFPNELSELYYQHPDVVCDELVLLIGDSEEKKALFIKVMNLRLHEKIILKLGASKLYFLIRLFEFEEIYNVLETECPSFIVPTFWEGRNPIAYAKKVKERDDKNKGFTEFCINLKVMLGTSFPKEKMNEMLDLYILNYKEPEIIDVKKY
jgi:hypothetical protein